MAAGSSPPSAASEKTSEGCRTTAANASPSSGALSPSTISTRRRSPRAGPSVISLSPTAAMASRRKRLARPRQLEDRAAVGCSPRELPERHRRLLARIEEAGALEDEPRLQEEAVLPLERDREARTGERRERHPRLLLRDVRQAEERAVLDQAARTAVGCLRRDVHPPHEARPVGPEDELPGAGPRDRRGRRQRVRLALPGRPLLAPYLLTLHVEDRRLGRLLHLDPGARLRAGVDHVRDLAPAPIEEAQVGEVGPDGR